MKTNRRNLLKGMAMGTVALSMPNFLAACAPKQATSALSGDPFAEWFGVDEAMVGQVMTELGRSGATFADVYFQHSRSTSVALEDGIVSKASSSVDQGVGLRVVIGDQVGYAYTEELTLEAMLTAARTAAAIAKAGAPVPAPPHYAFGPKQNFYTVVVPWSTVGIDQRLPLLEKTAALARAKDPAITKVSVSLQDDEQRVLVADLSGRIQRDIRPMSRLWVNLTAVKNGVSRSNSANLAGRRGLEFYDDAQLALVVQQAVDRTMVLFDARRPPAGELPVVLASGASGILLHEAIGHGMEADFNRKKVSIYADMMGRTIAPDFVTIVDDATCENERGALNHDDEGNPGKRTVLVEKGVLKSYLHDQISARHYGVEPTGSGRRESFRHVPMPRMRCTYMEPGPHSREEIIASVKNGIIAETFLNGEVQIGAGDFTFYIKNGWLIEDGKVTAPIADCNIIGNGPEALRNVTMVANDARLDTGGWTCGKDGQGVPVSQGLPTVLVSKMTVGGVHG